MYSTSTYASTSTWTCLSVHPVRRWIPPCPPTLGEMNQSTSTASEARARLYACACVRAEQRGGPGFFGFGSGSSTTPYLRRTFAHDRNPSIPSRAGSAGGSGRVFLANPQVALSRRGKAVTCTDYVCPVHVCTRCRRHGHREHGMAGRHAWFCRLAVSIGPSIPGISIPKREGKKNCTSMRGPRHRQTGERRPSTRQTPYPPRLFRGPWSKLENGVMTYRLESPCPFPPAAVLVLCLECLDAVPFGLCLYLGTLGGRPSQRGYREGLTCELSRRGRWENLVSRPACPGPLRKAFASASTRLGRLVNPADDDDGRTRRSLRRPEWRRCLFFVSSSARN